MSDDPHDKPADPCEETAREIRRTRRFSLSDAIGQLGGGDVMKGGSPVSRKVQAELEVEEYLRRHLADPGGVLRCVLQRHVGDSLLDSDYSQPLAALAAYLPRVLTSEHLLTELVREADAEWGRAHEERPYFQRPGGRPHPDDPYTIESVRRSLIALRDRLAAGDAAS